MSAAAAFDRILQLLWEDLTVIGQMAWRSSPDGPVPVESKVAITLRFLAGASYIDIQQIHGVHRSTLYLIITTVIDAMDRKMALSFQLDNIAELEAISWGFQRRNDSPIEGCVGALDGLAVQIERPGDDCANPASCYNRKGFYAMVVQAMCDSNYRFRFASVKCVGSTHDSVAFSVSSLAYYLEENGLPDRFWIAADEAYSRVRVCI